MFNWNDHKRLGFGLMRFPMKDGVIDMPAFCRLVDTFIANGFTYFDTAYVYEGSEVAFREAVVKRYPRDSYTVTSKLSGWILNDTLTPEKMFNEQLERAGVDYFDFYLLHSLQASREEIYNRYDCWSFCHQKMKEGKIKHFGCSYHGDPVFLDKLLAEHPELEFVQLQINYVDWDDNAIYSRENYEVCRKHNKDVVVMEPARGGYLSNLKPELQAKFEAVRPGASPSSFAMRYAGSLPGVRMVLSGMNVYEHLLDNMATFTDFEPLNDEERKVIDEVAKELLSMPTVPCTTCRYCCKDCPQSIDIPEIFKAYNMILTYGDHLRPHLYYDSVLYSGSGKAADCIACGQCESVCPQHIDIIKHLHDASPWLDK